MINQQTQVNDWFTINEVMKYQVYNDLFLSFDYVYYAVMPHYLRASLVKRKSNTFLWVMLEKGNYGDIVTL